LGGRVDLVNEDGHDDLPRVVAAVEDAGGGVARLVLQGVLELLPDPGTPVRRVLPNSSKSGATPSPEGGV